MTNNFVKASFFMIFQSIFCILSDVFSKKTAMDTQQLLFLRFWLSFVFLIIYNLHESKTNPSLNKTQSSFLPVIIAAGVFLLPYLKQVFDNCAATYNVVHPAHKYNLMQLLSLNSLNGPTSPTSLILFLFIISFILILISPHFKQKKLNFLSKNNLIRGFLFTISMMFFIYGLKKLSLGIVILLNFCTPILTTLLSKIFLKENLRQRLITCIINTIGILIAILPCIHSIDWCAVISVIAASSCFAAIDVFNKANLNHDENINQILTGSSLVSACCFSVLLCCNGEVVVIPSKTDLVLSVLIALLAILIPLFTLKASQYSDLSSLQPLRYIEFPVSIVSSYVCFNDTYTPHIFIAFVVIVIGTSWSYLKEIHNEQTTSN